MNYSTNFIGSTNTWGVDKRLLRKVAEDKFELPACNIHGRRHVSPLPDYGRLVANINSLQAQYLTMAKSVAATK